MALEFTKKLQEIVPYCDRFEKITLFELTQHFGSYLFLIMILLCSLPLFIFSAEIIALPLSALCIMCSIWYFFEVSLWLPDSMKGWTISSRSVKKVAVWTLGLIDRWRHLVGPQDRFDQYWVVLGPLAVSCMAIAAFVTGFAQSPSFLPVFSLFLLPIGLLIMDVSIVAGGCLFLLLEALRSF